jgi:hypothetical protein
MKMSVMARAPTSRGFDRTTMSWAVSRDPDTCNYLPALCLPALTTRSPSPPLKIGV